MFDASYVQGVVLSNMMCLTQESEPFAANPRVGVVEARREVRRLLVCLLGVSDPEVRAALSRPTLSAALSSIDADHSHDPVEVRRYLLESLSSTREVCSLSETYLSESRLSDNEASSVQRHGRRVLVVVGEALGAVAATRAPAAVLRM